MKKLRNNGFTLVELLVVIVIIGILASVIVPSVADNIEKANQSSAKQTAKTIWSDTFMNNISTDYVQPERVIVSVNGYLVNIVSGGTKDANKINASNKATEETKENTIGSETITYTVLTEVLYDGTEVVDDGAFFIDKTLTDTRYFQYFAELNEWQQMVLIGGAFSSMANFSELQLEVIKRAEKFINDAASAPDFVYFVEYKNFIFKLNTGYETIGANPPKLVVKGIYSFYANYSNGTLLERNESGSIYRFRYENVTDIEFVKTTGQYTMLVGIDKSDGFDPTKYSYYSHQLKTVSDMEIVVPIEYVFEDGKLIPEYESTPQNP